MKRFKKRGYNIPRTKIRSEPIKVSTSDFVVFNISPDKEGILNLKNGQYQVSGIIGHKKTNNPPEMQCKIK